MELGSPEEKARRIIDRNLAKAGWKVVSRDEYVPDEPVAVKEALMHGNHEADYLLFIDGKAIAVLEAKRGENALGEDVERQAEGYAHTPQDWYGLWFQGMIPLVYLANGKKIRFRNLRDAHGDYVDLSEMHSPKKMLKMIGKKTRFGTLPNLEKNGLRDCQYRAEIAFENALKQNHRKSLAVLATGSGKTYLACLACYRLLNYTPVRRVLFLVDRNNLARQTNNEFCTFDRTENGQDMGSLYDIRRLQKDADIHADIVISTIQKLYAVLTGNPMSEEAEDAEDERNTADEEKESCEAVTLSGDLVLRPDHFQLILSIALYLDEKTLSKYPKDEFMRDTDIVINSTGTGTLGRVGIYHTTDNPSNYPIVPDSHVTVIRTSNVQTNEYCYYYLKKLQPYLESFGTGTSNQTELSTEIIKSILIPLPPLAEQRRIVERLGELLGAMEDNNR